MAPSLMVVTAECDKSSEYQPLSAFFGKDWPSRESKFLPDFVTFNPDQRSLHDMHSEPTSRAATIRCHAVPRDIIDDEFPISPGTQPWDVDEEDPAEFDDILFGTEFDRSCLRALDRQLLLHPIESFIDLCWAEAITEDHEPRPQSIHLYSSSDSSIDYDESDPEDGDLTPNDGRSEETPFEDRKHFVHFDSYSSISNSSPTPSDDGGKIPLVFLDAHFPISNPNDSIQFFPVSPLARRRADRKLPNPRMATFLPGRFIKSTAA